MYSIPAHVVDVEVWPAPIYTSDLNSFAQRTLAVRVPQILRDTIETYRHSASNAANLELLYVELMQGVMQPLSEQTEDRTYWDAAGEAYWGKSWRAVPWFWAEAFFYRRILEATRYFQPGPTFRLDPYAATKAQEWQPQAAPATVNRLLANLPGQPSERFERLLHASLWGNRTDLSYNVAGHLPTTATRLDEAENLLVDDTPAIWTHLLDRPAAAVSILCDNAGTEFLMDLALTDFLISDGIASHVSLHLKPQPYFVSDTMPADVEDGLVAMEAFGDEALTLADRIRGYLEQEKVSVVTHWYNSTSLFYFELPSDLRSDLAAQDLVIVKGDANYRRLHGDRHWPFETPFAEVLSYFPAPIVALRTLKGEHCLGLPEGLSQQLSSTDPDWLINGQRGVIQAHLGD